MSKKGVFIIESLEFKDEKADRFEGKLLSEILKLGGIPCQYFYLRTQAELETILEEFEKSEYRYLHISCHGSKTSIYTTLDVISFDELADLITPYLDKRRLFLSACSAAKDDLAKEIFPYCKCYSIIGFDEDIYFHDAAIMWASFYHVILKKDFMKRIDISNTIEVLAKLYDMPINYFGASSIRKSKYRLKQFNIK